MNNQECICDRFRTIRKRYDEAYKRSKGSGRCEDPVELQDTVSDLMDIIETMYGEAEGMRDSAQKMEDRLGQYRRAIECLGFERVKKNEDTTKEQ